MKNFTKSVILGAMIATASASAGFAAGGDGGYSVDTESLNIASALIQKKDFAGALKVLAAAKNDDPRNADIYNLTAFSQRNLGQNDAALGNYLIALKLDPEHKGAHEYLGELYIKTGKMDKAKELEARLVEICNGACDELDDLREAIAKAGG